jgi:DNA gyrase subunit A
MAQGNKENKIEGREITSELRESYLDYAMSVIISRALPDVRDGLKPVHRRILWAMWESGLTHQAKYRKSANVVGAVLGGYHPHSDTAVYDALARLAQPFSLRYPLIDGQGNWGDIDGDPPAAMRYTECRLSSIASTLLEDIGKETVDFISNYDDSKKEPTVLPAKLPNLLINGSDGIAVGMATKIPPHNLGEIVGAATHLIDNPRATSEDLMEFIKGPDFPTGGVIYNRKGIVETYTSGRGAITTRGVAEVEEKKIIITEIPYQVNKAELIIKMAELVRDKRIEGIRDIRDESSREGLRIVIELKSDAVAQKILNRLWQHTDLQKDFHLNTVALTEGLQPETLSVRDILAGFIEHRKNVVVRRTKFDLARAEERAHILEGLVKALSQIDKVIATIKKSKDREDAQKNLIKRFKLTTKQADAILEMRLQTLAALERKKIEDELKEKRELIKELSLLLKSPKKILEVIKNELKDLKDKFGDERRTKIHEGELRELAAEDMVAKEEVVIAMSSDGYIKRIPPTMFKRQRRGGKGLKGSTIRDTDMLTHFVGASTHDNILFFTDKGRAFQTKVYEIPAGTRISKGKAIHNFLEIPNDEKVSAIVAYDSEKLKKNFYIVMVTSGGIVKKTDLNNFANIRRSGIIAIKLTKGDFLMWAELVSAGNEIVLNTNFGRAIRFKDSDVRSMGRTAAGVRGIRLRKDDLVSSFDIIDTDQKNSNLLVVMANGYAKQTPLKDYKVQHRGGSGILTAKVTSKTGSLVSSHVIIDETELLAISARGQILKTSIKSIRKAGRATQGVKIMKLDKDDKLVGTVSL